ncbi:MAG: glutaredoxin 3 [Gammaproteobacteria bacterium]|nr:glutaredoxin 3 [Gammaproteobacteria bacterium]
MAKVTMYSTGSCPYCIRAKHLLQSKEVHFTDLRVDQETRLRAEMIQRSQGRSSVPQVFIGQQHIGGCDELHALERAGKLDSLLKA